MSWKTNDRITCNAIRKGILSVKISDLGFTVRALNVLNVAEIRTVAELMMILPNKDEMRHFRNCGMKTINEIDNVRGKIQSVLDSVK